MTDPAVFIVLGLGYGDEGKGTVTEALVSRFGAKLVVRFNGGPQAAHHVVRPDGTVHCFSQFGSGTFEGAATYLAPTMLVDIIALENEAEVLKSKGIIDPYQLLTVHKDCVLVTPYHKLYNRILEVARGPSRHGSCGRGVGVAWLESLNPAMVSLRLGDLADPKGLRETLKLLSLTKLDQAEQVTNFGSAESFSCLMEDLAEPSRLELLLDRYVAFAERLGPAIVGDHKVLEQALPSGVIFEGAQGILLDYERGFRPHVTKTDTSANNALSLLEELAYKGDPMILGVTRTYATRHGAGPFLTEDESLDSIYPELHNGRNEWQGAFRLGALDLPALKYAVSVSGGVKALAVTHCDRFLAGARICPAYRYKGSEASMNILAQGLEVLGDCHAVLEAVDDVGSLLASIEAATGRAVFVQSWGPSKNEKTFLE